MISLQGRHSLLQCGGNIDEMGGRMRQKREEKRTGGKKEGGTWKYENRMISRALIDRQRKDELTRLSQVMQLMQRGYVMHAVLCCAAI